MASERLAVIETTLNGVKNEMQGLRKDLRESNQLQRDFNERLERQIGKVDARVDKAEKNIVRIDEALRWTKKIGVVMWGILAGLLGIK